MLAAPETAYIDSTDDDMLIYECAGLAYLLPESQVISFVYIAAQNFFMQLQESKPRNVPICVASPLNYAIAAERWFIGWRSIHFISTWPTAGKGIAPKHWVLEREPQKKEGFKRYTPPLKK